jgi:hypothetical protein
MSALEFIQLGLHFRPALLHLVVQQGAITLVIHLIHSELSLEE